MLVTLPAVAIPPTVPASNLSFNSIEGSFVNLGWRVGDGSRRLIIAKAGSPVTARPQNGIDYTENNNFMSGQQIAPGEYVVYDNVFTSFYLTGLSPATQYFFAIFEYNGSGNTTEYLTTSFLSGSASTVSAPTEASSELVFSNITTVSVKLDWQIGNGGRRLVVARQGSAVTGAPVDLQNYSANSSYTSGAQVGSGNYAVYASSGNSVVVTNLQPGTTYYFSIFEFNGANQPVYLATAHTGNVTTRSMPTVPSSNISVTRTDGKELALNWASGNGLRRIIVAKQGSAVTGVPQNGTDYNANTTFGSGPTLAAGEYVVYDDNGNGANIYGLDPATVYFFKIFEYDGTGVNTVYLTSLTGTISASTAIKPVTQSSGVAAANITATSLLLTFNEGNGRGRFVVARADVPVNIVPQDLIAYQANSDFGSGHNFGNGNFALSNSLDEGLHVNNLRPGTTYHFAVFEYNGQNQPLYLSPAAVFSATTLVALPVKLAAWTIASRDNKVELKWTTAMEENSSHFNVQRSNDGIHFSTIRKINAAGESQSAIHYNIIDDAPASGQNYYRLQMVDRDEKTEYSSVLSAWIGDTGGKVKVLGNPVTDKLVVILPAIANAKSEWRIINAGGQLISRGTAAGNRLEVNSAALRAGIYWLQVTVGSMTRSVSFIKN